MVTSLGVKRSRKLARGSASTPDVWMLISTKLLCKITLLEHAASRLVLIQIEEAGGCALRAQRYFFSRLICLTRSAADWKSSGVSARQGKGQRGSGASKNSSRRRAAHWSWLDTPWPCERKITCRESGRYLAASRPQLGGVSQS